MISPQIVVSMQTVTVATSHSFVK